MRSVAPLALAVVISLGLYLPGAGHTQGASPNLAPPRPQLQRIPYKEERGPGLGSLLVRAAGGLVLIAGLTFGVALLAKRYLPGVRGFSRDGTTRIQLLESRRITPKLTLLVIEFEGERLLLAQSGDRVLPLATRPGPDPKREGSA